jgi:hypothetical protein
LGAKALPYILDGSLDHMVDMGEDSEDIKWIYELDLEEATLRTINSDDEEIGYRKFEDLTIEYMRDLELADESRRNHQRVVAAEVDDGKAGLQGLLILILMQSLSVLSGHPIGHNHHNVAGQLCTQRPLTWLMISQLFLNCSVWLKVRIRDCLQSTSHSHWQYSVKLDCYGI